MSRIGKYMQIEGRLVAARGCEEGEWETTTYGYRASFWGGENVLEVDSYKWGPYNIADALSVPELFTFKWLILCYVNFVSVKNNKLSLKKQIFNTYIRKKVLKQALNKAVTTRNKEVCSICRHI